MCLLMKKMYTFNQAIPFLKYVHFPLHYIFFASNVMIRRESQDVSAMIFREALFDSEKV